jgi:hypothetical protein
MGASPVPTVSAELYDPETGAWTVTGSMGTAHAWHTATLLSDGRVLVAGGTTNIRLSAEIYDTARGTWTATSPMVVERPGHTATLLDSGQVLIVGRNADGQLASAELFDPATRLWVVADTLTLRVRSIPPSFCPAAECWWQGASGASFRTTVRVRRFMSLRPGGLRQRGGRA